MKITSQTRGKTPQRRGLCYSRQNFNTNDSLYASRRPKDTGHLLVCAGARMFGAIISSIITRGANRELGLRAPLGASARGCDLNVRAPHRNVRAHLRRWLLLGGVYVPLFITRKTYASCTTMQTRWPDITVRLAVSSRGFSQLRTSEAKGRGDAHARSLLQDAC